MGLYNAKITFFTHQFSQIFSFTKSRQDIGLKSQKTHPEGNEVKNEVA